MYTIGCDQHKSYCFMVIMDERNKIVNKKRINHSNRIILNKYFENIPKGSKMAIEACGYESWLCDLAESKGIEIHLAHPLKTKAIAEAKIKTDKIDAITLAKLLRSDLLPEAYFAPKQIREQRYLLRYRQYLVKYQTSIKNRVHSLLDRQGIEKPFMTDLFSPKGLKWINNLKLPNIYQQILDEQLKMLQFVKERIKETEKQIDKIIKNDPRADLLQTVPGIGKFSAFLLLSEIGDITRFRTAEKLCSYAGLVPSVHQSGQVQYHGSITKQGNKFIRWICTESAHRAIRQDPGLTALYKRIHLKKGSHKATIAVSRKLLTYVYHVLTKNESYKFH